jgi:hypothetical protein
MELLAKALQILFFVGAGGAAVVVIFVIRDYLRVILSKDTVSETSGTRGDG